MLWVLILLWLEPPGFNSEQRCLIWQHRPCCLPRKMKRPSNSFFQLGIVEIFYLLELHPANEPRNCNIYQKKDYLLKFRPVCFFMHYIFDPLKIWRLGNQSIALYFILYKWFFDTLFLASTLHGLTPSPITYTLHGLTPSPITSTLHGLIPHPPSLSHTLHVLIPPLSLSHYMVCLGLEGCVWPGRYQKITEPNVTYYLDGAHTNTSIEVTAFSNVYIHT